MTWSKPSGDGEAKDDEHPDLGCALLVMGSAGTIGILESYDEVAARLDAAGSNEMLEFTTYDAENRAGRILLERRFVIGVFEVGASSSHHSE